MRSDHFMSRRQAIGSISLAALLGSTSLAQAQSTGLFWRIVARAPLYALVGVVAWKLLKDDKATAAPQTTSANAIEAAEQALRRREEEERLAAQRAAERPYAMRLAQQTGMDQATAEEIVRAIGVDPAKRIVEERLAVWPQRDTSDQRILDIALENRSSQPITGAMRIAIDDVASGAREFEYRYHGYLIQPNSTLHHAVPFRATFKRSGFKRVSLINQPRQVVASAVELFVLPGEIRRA